MGTRTKWLVWSIALFLSFSACNSDDCSSAVIDMEGVVRYWESDGFESYTIQYTVPNTIDSVVVGFVDDLPPEFEVEGLIVLFSGDLIESDDLPKPQIGGQNLSKLTLCDVKKL